MLLSYYMFVIFISFLRVRVVCMHSIVCHKFFFCMSFVYHHVSKLQLIVVMGSKSDEITKQISTLTYTPAVILLPAVYIITHVNAQICSSPTCSITDRRFTSTSQICTHHNQCWKCRWTNSLSSVCLLHCSGSSCRFWFFTFGLYSFFLMVTSEADNHCVKLCVNVRRCLARRLRRGSRCRLAPVYLRMVQFWFQNTEGSAQ